MGEPLTELHEIFREEETETPPPWQISIRSVKFGDLGPNPKIWTHLPNFFVPQGRTLRSISIVGANKL